MKRPPALVNSNPSGYLLYLLYVACYVMWFGLSALGLWLFWGLRVNLLDLALILGLERWAGFIHNLGILLLGLLWVVFFIFLEDYLRKGVKRGDMWQRAGGVLLVMLLALGVSYAFQYFAPYLVGPVASG